MPEHDLLVIGGGPAGIMAASRAAERGRRVILLERGPEPGRKLLLTGGGRCNLTNTAPIDRFLNAFGRSGGFLRNALARFGPDELRSWLHARGVRTAALDDGCVFASGGGAGAVLAALLAEMRRRGVQLALNRRVQTLRIESGRLAGVVAEGRLLPAPRVLVATGGLSYPQTGSTGDGYSLARQAGHSIEPTYPAVTALETSEMWPAALQGTAIPAARIRALGPRGRRLAESTGPAVWTHFGLSGPPVLDVSSAAVQALRRGEPVSLELDLVPDQSEPDLERTLLHAARGGGKKKVITFLAGLVARRTAAALLQAALVDPETQLAQCTHAERIALVRVLKRLQLRVARPRPIEEATVTGGGVALNEVDPRRMESRLLRGLHFAGEVLDLQAPCGGFNLQAAFSAGYLVGDSV